MPLKMISNIRGKSFYDILHPSYAQLHEYAEQKKEDNYKTDNILDGLDNYDPTDTDYKKSVNRLTLLASNQEDSTLVVLMTEFLRSYENERRIHRTIDEDDVYGRSALHWMVGSGNELGYKKLLEKGAKLEIRTTLEGFTPAMVACSRGLHVKHLNYLISKGADVNARAYSSATLFHIATASGNRSCMRSLVINGADPRATMNDGRCAFDFVYDDETRRLLHTCFRSFTIRQEKKDAKCAACGEKPTDGELKRCSNCYSEFYCNRECQTKHWEAWHKNTCQGYMVANHIDPNERNIPLTQREEKNLHFKPNKADLSAHDFKAFTVEAYAALAPVSEGPEEIIKIINLAKGIRMRILKKSNDEEKFKRLLRFVVSNGEGDKQSVYFWARYRDPSKAELLVYHSKGVTPPTILETDDEKQRKKEKKEKEFQQAISESTKGEP